MSEYERELAVAERAAREAGEVLAAHYARGSIAVETKSDSSPVTAADRDANAVIAARLAEAFPDDALLSEELPDDGGRLARRRVWIVDPLDGTRDFVARTGDFCVHVGLAVDGAPVVGVVFHVVAGALYAATAGGGAVVVDGAGARTPLRVSGTAAAGDLRVGVSRMSPGPRLAACLAATGLDRRAVAMGASVKLVALARGDLDAALNVGGGEQEWDTCAPEIVVREAGGAFTDCDGVPFRYNQRDVTHRRGSIASNGACHAALVELVRPFVEAPAGGEPRR